MPRGRKPALTEKRLIAALEANAGIRSFTAKALGVDPKSIDYWLARSEKVRNALREIDERVSDIVEGHLKTAINKGERWALVQWMRFKMSSRGFYQRMEVHHRMDDSALNSEVDGMSEEELRAAIEAARPRIEPPSIH
jgi:hypothetical protein